MDDGRLDAALAAARAAADAAEIVIARYYRRSVAVEHKLDESPVTVADREAELEIRRVLQATYPGHGYYGEEYGRSTGGSDYLWLIDPIDGTKSFVRDYPFFSTQVALMRGDALVLGVSSARQFGEAAWARRGGGAWLDGARIRVSACTTIAQAAISFGNLKTLAASARWQHLARVVQDANRTRGYGDFYHYHLLARGSIDAVIESDVNILDIAALVVIVREAGGMFTDLDGGEITLATTSVLAASTPELHRALLDALR